MPNSLLEQSQRFLPLGSRKALRMIGVANVCHRIIVPTTIYVPTTRSTKFMSKDSGDSKPMHLLVQEYAQELRQSDSGSRVNTLAAWRLVPIKALTAQGKGS